MGRAEPTPWTRLEPWAALLALLGCALKLARGIGPDPFFNSDCAVPLLLMRGLGDGPFTLFYPRQDRYGMWPFLVARWLHLGTPEAFHVLSVLALCSAAIPLWRLLGSPALAVVTLLAPVPLDRLVAWNTFQAGQPYLWQVVTLCWAWWACRGALGASTRRARLLAALGLLVAAALSAWISVVSLLALLGLLVLEAVRARAGPPRGAGAFSALGLATLFEAQLHRLYNAFCKRRFGERFITVMHLDRGNLGSNLGAVAAVAWREGVVIPLLLGTALLPLPGWTRSRRIDQLVFLWLATCCLPVFVVVDHFRENFFAGRYFSFPAYWAFAAAAHGGLVLLAALAGALGPGVRCLALALLVLVMPTSPRDPLAERRAAAQALVGPEPRLLLGDYWDVYVPAALAPSGALVPLPKEGDLNRFPLVQDALRPGRIVLLACALDGPAGTARQHGALLRRTAAPALPGENMSWCPHTVETPARPIGPSR
ncbi:MAG TPA: hypothetical protein VMH40_11875 [Myxococcaceae bacterium]|nr:hypothetical protein [Myxococcaceae bacterium]